MRARQKTDVVRPATWFTKQTGDIVYSRLALFGPAAVSTRGQFAGGSIDRRTSVGSACIRLVWAHVCAQALLPVFGAIGLGHCARFHEFGKRPVFPGIRPPRKIAPSPTSVLGRAWNREGQIAAAGFDVIFEFDFVPRRGQHRAGNRKRLFHHQGPMVLLSAYHERRNRRIGANRPPWRGSTGNMDATIAAAQQQDSADACRNPKDDCWRKSADRAERCLHAQAVPSIGQTYGGPPKGRRIQLHSIAEHDPRNRSSSWSDIWMVLLTVPRAVRAHFPMLPKIVHSATS